MIRFKKSLALFEKYTLRTRIVTWDEKWFYLEQTFLQGDKVAAVGHIKGLLRSKDGNVPPPQVLQGLGMTATAPQNAEYLRVWQGVDDLLKA